jgi:hypothetical protein
MIACVLAPLDASPLFARSFEWPDWAALRAKYPDAAAVYLLDETTTSIGSLSRSREGQTVDTHKVIAILDPARAAEWLSWDIPDYEFFKLRRLEARTWTSADVSRKVEKKQFFDIQLFPDYVLFADARGKRFTFPAVSQQTVIELEYEHTNESIYSYEQHLFANSIPTRKSRVAVRVPVEYLQNEFDQTASARRMSPNPHSASLPTAQGQAREFVWELEDQPALVSEPSMPPFADLAPSLGLAPRLPDRIRWSWESNGQEYYDHLFAPQLRGDGAIRALAAQLTTGMADPAQKCRAIYRFVQSNVRYVAVELGIGGFQPHPAPEVMARRYGDCKDKVTLMLCLLHEAGLDGYAALVRTRSAGEVDTALINFGQFNHMIAWVPIAGRDWWLDPTAEYCDADYLPAEDQGVMALVLVPNASRFLVTPTYAPESNTFDRRVRAKLGADGALSGTLELRGRGELSMRLRAAFTTRSPSEQQEFADRLLSGSIGGARSTAFRIAGIDSRDRPVVVAIDFECPRCATAVDGTLVLPADFLTPPALGDALRKPTRVQPILFDYLEQHQDHVRIAPPEGYRIEPPPEAEHRSNWFTYFGAASLDSAALVLDRRLSVDLPAIPVRDYAAARKEFELILADYAAPIRFRAP